MIGSEPRRLPVWSWIWLPGVVLGAAAWFALGPPDAPDSGPPAIPPHAPVMADMAAQPFAPAARLPTLPDVDVPPGPELDAHGNLRPTRALRSYYDYFDALGADVTVDRAARDDIAARVPEPAASQAFSLWQRYRQYLAAARSLAAGRTQLSASVQRASLEQIERLRTQLAERRAMRQQYLADVATLWFADDDAYDDAMLDRLAVAAQPDLDADERQRRLNAAEARLPAAMREARVSAEQPLRISETVASMRAQGHSTQDIAAALAQDFGGDVAQRYALQAQAEQGWNDRYADYARQRRQIDQSTGLTEADRQQQSAQLRAQMFADPSEALRAYVTDVAAAAGRADAHR